MGRYILYTLGLNMEKHSIVKVLIVRNSNINCVLCLLSTDLSTIKQCTIILHLVHLLSSVSSHRLKTV